MPGIDPTKDPDFMKASPADQAKYLSAVDPDFAAASPKDQQGYLVHLRGNGPLLPPAVQRPQVNMQEMPGSASLIGQSALRPTPQDTQAYQEHPVAATALGAAGLSTAIPGVLPFLGRAGVAVKRAAPWIAAGEASEYARKNLPLGKYIPAGAESLLMLMGLTHGAGAGKPAAPEESVYPGAPEPTIPPEVQQGQPLSKVTPSGALPASQTGEALSNISAPQQAPTPNLPFLPNPRTNVGRLPYPEGQNIDLSPGMQTPGGAVVAPRIKGLLPGEVQAPETPVPSAPPPPPPKVTQKQVQSQLEGSLGAPARPTIKPGVPLRNQGAPAESSAVDDYHYDPDAKELHITPKGGGKPYVYGDVSPEQAQAFDSANSKGKAWAELRQSPGVTLVRKGDINVRRVQPTENPLDEGAAIYATRHGRL